MKSRTYSERGQALVLIAFAIIGLIGIMGLSVDGGIAFSDRRHAQNTADAAAYAGALGKIQPTVIDSKTGKLSPYLTMQQNARARADSNDYFGDLVHSQVEIYTCNEEKASCEYPYTGDSNYVQVIITSHVNMFFAHIIGIPQVHNRVQAVALANSEVKGDLYDGAGIVSLNPDCPQNGSFIVNGAANINLVGGGMLTNSNDACAFKCGMTCTEKQIAEGKCGLKICNKMSDDGITCLEKGTITSATANGSSGGFFYGGQCEIGMLAEEDAGGKEQYPYPPKSPVLSEPEWECNPAHLGTAQTVDGKDLLTGASIKYSKLIPGYYGEFPPKKLQNHLYLTPGIYCVDSTLKLNTDKLQIYSKDVTIWVRANNGVTINGGVIQLFASQTGDYAGYLNLVEPDYGSSITACDIEGNAYNHYEGAIYAPHCDVKITGTADTPTNGIDSQIIGYNVTLIGNANLNINYDSDKNPDEIKAPELGLTK